MSRHTPANPIDSRCNLSILIVSAVPEDRVGWDCRRVGTIAAAKDHLDALAGRSQGECVVLGGDRIPLGTRQDQHRHGVSLEGGSPCSKALGRSCHKTLSGPKRDAHFLQLSGGIEKVGGDPEHRPGLVVPATEPRRVAQVASFEAAQLK